MTTKNSRIRRKRGKWRKGGEEVKKKHQVDADDSQTDTDNFIGSNSSDNQTFDHNKEQGEAFP